MFVKQYVETQTLASEKVEDLVTKLREEDGEIASWMIVLAFLVVAAVYARDQIGPALEGAIDTVAGSF